MPPLLLPKLEGEQVQLFNRQLYTQDNDFNSIGNVRLSQPITTRVRNVNLRNTVNMSQNNFEAMADSKRGPDHSVNWAMRSYDQSITKGSLKEILQQ